jgi:hypothetical protein
MSANYQIVELGSTVDRRQLSEFLCQDGQFLLPLVYLIEQDQCAVDEVIDVMGWATIEANERQLRVDKPSARARLAGRTLKRESVC